MDSKGRTSSLKAADIYYRDFGRKNWLFTWFDDGAERTDNILSIVATCIAHDVNPRAYLHKVIHCILLGWPQDKLRELLPDRILAAHPELYVGDPDALPLPSQHQRIYATRPDLQSG